MVRGRNYRKAQTVIDISNFDTVDIDGIEITDLSLEDMVEQGLVKTFEDLRGATIALREKTTNTLRGVRALDSADTTTYTDSGFVVVDKELRIVGDMFFLDSLTGWALVDIHGRPCEAVGLKGGSRIITPGNYEWHIVVDSSDEHPGWVPLSKLGDNPASVLVNPRDALKSKTYAFLDNNDELHTMKCYYTQDALRRGGDLWDGNWAVTSDGFYLHSILMVALGDFGKALRDRIFIKEKHYKNLQKNRKPVEFKSGQIFALADGRQLKLHGDVEAELA